MKKSIKILVCVLVALLVICGGLVVWMLGIYHQLSDDPYQAFAKPTINISVEEQNNTIVDERGTKHTKTDRIVNVLFLGIDSNTEREAKHKGYRSDMMMLCSVNFQDNTMRLLSMPRDLWVDVYEVNTATGEVTGTVKNRINTAYGKGGGPEKYGAENAMRTVENFLSMGGKFDIEIDYYISMDIDGLTQIADAIGGVDVVLDQSIPKVGNKGETVTITSKNIDDYIRSRKKTGGDYARAERQQQYIMGMAKKIKSMGAAKAAPKLYDEVLAFARTNLTLDQIVSLAVFLDGFDMDDLTRHTVAADNASKNGASVLEVREDELYRYLLEYFYDQVEE